MTPENRKEFDGALLKIAKLYGYELDKEQAELYFSILADYSVDEIKNGLLICARTSKFFPKPSEVIEAMGGRKGGIDYDFQYCISMIKELGFHSSVVLKNALLMVVIKDLGGLQEFSEMVSKDEKDTYFRFMRAYNRRVIDQKNGDLPEVKRLVGYMEHLSKQSGAGGTYHVAVWDNKKVKELIGGAEQNKLLPGEKVEPPADVMGLVNKLTGRWQE